MLSALRRLSRPTVAYLHDVLMAGLSFALSLYLRLGQDVLGYGIDFIIAGTAAFAAVAAMVYLWMDLYRGVWRYASLNDLLAIARAVTVIILVFLPIMFLTTRLADLPRSVVVINWFVLVTLLAAPRILYRMLKDGRFELTYDRHQDQRIKVLLIGAGDAAEMFIQAMTRRTRSEYQPVAILDEAERRVGRHIRGVPILGGIDDLQSVVERLRARGTPPQRLIIAKSDVGPEKMRRLVDEAGHLGLTVARLPRLTEFRSAGAEEVEVRPVAIEDLLGRPQNVPNRGAMKALIAGKRVLVTGAGGSIGGELVRQLVEIGPVRLVLVDNSEFNLYSIEMEVRERLPDLPVRAVIGDVRDRERITRLIADERPEVVFHAAALKHVPMVEANPVEGVLTNVIGTRNVAEACRAHGVVAMVLISTDKAVNPTNVMGATKRLAESYCQALDVSGAAQGSRTRFVTVRFGNVLGSTGSVVPLFQRQLAAGGPLTVTHPEIKRYFMTVREAVELVLQASALGVGGVDGAAPSESGKIFVLDMGEPIRIADLARQMIRLAGHRPDRDVQIVFTGLRPGEKLNEELFHAAEALRPTVIKGVLLADPRTADYAFLARGVDELQAASEGGRVETALSLIMRHVPEYVADPALLSSVGAADITASAQAPRRS
jgi:FlaA1/EpsC-like NDP-sugar epimerase